MEKLNEILHELGISKVKLANFLGVSRQMIYNYLEFDSINKWPKDKKVLLLNLLGVKSVEEIDNINYGSFETTRGYDKELIVRKYEIIDEFLDEEQRLEECVTKLYNEEQLTTEEMALLINFLDIYITNLENQIDVPSNLQIIADKWYENSSVNNEISKQPQELQEIFEKVRLYRKNRVKMYEPTELNDAAFITTFALLESSLVIGLIVALISLFK